MPQKCNDNHFLRKVKGFLNCLKKIIKIIYSIDQEIQISRTPKGSSSYQLQEVQIKRNLMARDDKKLQAHMLINVRNIHSPNNFILLKFPSYLVHPTPLIVPIPPPQKSKLKFECSNYKIRNKSQSFDQKKKIVQHKLPI